MVRTAGHFFVQVKPDIRTGRRLRAAPLHAACRWAAAQLAPGAGQLAQLPVP